MKLQSHILKSSIQGRWDKDIFIQEKIILSTGTRLAFLAWGSVAVDVLYIANFSLFYPLLQILWGLIIFAACLFFVFLLKKYKTEEQRLSELLENRKTYLAFWDCLEAEKCNPELQKLYSDLSLTDAQSVKHLQAFQALTNHAAAIINKIEQTGSQKK